METVRRRFQKSYYRRRQSRAAPRGCLTVCVGPMKQRFVIKIEHANHPRFLSLLEDANNGYGSPIHNHGPIYIPCDVHVFCEALAEMEKPPLFDSSFPIVPRCFISLIRRLCFTFNLNPRFRWFHE